MTAPTTRLGQAIDSGGAPGTTTTLIVLAVLVGITFLCWAGKVSGDAYVGLVGGIIAGTLVRGGVAAGFQASQAPPAAED